MKFRQWMSAWVGMIAAVMLAAGAIGCDTGNGGGAPIGGGSTTIGGGNNGNTGGNTATNGSGGNIGTSTGTYNGRAYKMYVPASYSPNTATPVVVAMHGAGDTYGNFFAVAMQAGWQAAADAEGFIFVVPAHMNSTRASFLHFSGNQFDLTATTAEANSLLAAIYYGVGASFNLDTTAIFWVGFSEGAVFAEVAATQLSAELRAIAPFAGAVASKPFPLARKIPVIAVCGTQDSGFAGVQSGFGEWQAAGHTAQSHWVNGVGHSFSSLCAFGPSPAAVFQWMETASAGPVQSAFNPGNGGANGGNNNGNGTGGSGGQYPGAVTITLAVANLGNEDVHLYVPTSYSPATPMPLLIGLHGAGGAGTAPAAAKIVRDSWGTVAESEGFIVVAIEATGSQGGWIVGEAGAVINAALTEIYAKYNIDTTRVYGWGFSAGGHLMHLLALDNADFFAAYAVNAGVLQGLASQYGKSPATASRTIPVAIFIGTSDSLNPYAQADRTAFENAGWTAGSTLQFTEFTGGHTFSTSHLQQIWQFIGSKSTP